MSLVSFYFDRILDITEAYGTLCAIWYYLYLKRKKNTHGGVSLLVKLQAEACNFTKSNIPPWVFFTFSKFYNWYQTRKASHMLNSKIAINYSYS